MYEPGTCCCTLMLFYVCVQGVGENACAKKSHEKYLIALKGSGLAFPEDKLACGVQEQGAGTSTLAVQGLCVFLKKKIKRLDFCCFLYKLLLKKPPTNLNET